MTVIYKRIGATAARTSISGDDHGSGWFGISMMQGPDLKLPCICSSIQHLFVVLLRRILTAKINDAFCITEDTETRDRFNRVLLVT